MEDDFQLESFRSWVAGVGIAATLAGAPSMSRAQDAISKPVDTAVALIAHGPYKPTLPIKLVSSRPANISAEANAWVERDSNDNDIAICVATYTGNYKRAMLPGDEGLSALRILAAQIAHEQVHVLHGPREEDAYDGQIQVMQQLGASPLDIILIRKSKDKAVKQQQDIYKKARETAANARK